MDKARWMSLVMAMIAVVVVDPTRAEEPPREGVRAPALTTRDLEGAPFNLYASLDRGPVLVTFWTTWCKPCRKELPALAGLETAYRDRGLSVVAVNGDGPVDRAKIVPYVRAHGFEFTVVLDPDGRVRRRFRVEAFPTTLLIDTQGIVVHRQVGYRKGDEKILEATLVDLLGPEDPTGNP